jgi:hypothetical protein
MPEMIRGVNIFLFEDLGDLNSPSEPRLEVDPCLLRYLGGVPTGFDVGFRLLVVVTVGMGLSPANLLLLL